MHPHRLSLRELAAHAAVRRLRDNGNGLTGAEAFAQWMDDPSSHLWDTEQPWNYTAGCGPRNTPGPEKRGADGGGVLQK